MERRSASGRWAASGPAGRPAWTPPRASSPACRWLLTGPGRNGLEQLRLLLAGNSLEAIARQMGLSDKTVSNYQTLVRQKLGMASAHELLHYAREHGLVR